MADSSGNEPGRDPEVLAAFDRLQGLLRSGRAAVGNEPDLEEFAVSWDEARALGAGLYRRLAGVGEESVQDGLALSLEELEAEARDLFNETDEKDPIVARRLALLRAHSRLIRRITRAAEGLQPREETPFLLGELREIEAALEPDKRAVGDDETDTEAASEVARVSGELVDLRRRIVVEQADRLLGYAQTLVNADASTAGVCFRASRALLASQRELSTLGHDAEAETREKTRTVLDRLEAESLRLDALFIEFCQAARSAEDLETVQLAANWMTGELDEIRVTAAGIPHPRELVRLKATERDAQRLAQACEVAAKQVRSDFSNDATDERWKRAIRPVRRLARMRRRFSDFASDRALAFRLNRIFGPRMVKIWDAMIFWLILVVLALIVIDHYVDPSLALDDGTNLEALEERIAKAGGRWTDWLDTLICGIFLLDFFTRMFLSPRRLRYFQRNFLTEFVPSLPFAWLSTRVAFLDFGRYSRPLRLLRALRAVMRVFRILLFTTRAADRIVERNAWFLNRSILFFTDPVKDESVPTLLKRARDLDAWIRRGTSRVFRELSLDGQLAAAAWHRRLLESAVVHDDGGVVAIANGPERDRALQDDLDVDDVIKLLRELDDSQVAEILGVEMARQLTASLRLFRFPVLRRLPVARFVLGPTGAPDPLWATARLGRVAGDFLAWVQRSINWFADLYGTITGAQFLDRLGTQLVKATARPARRLLMFGGAAMLVVFLVWLLRLTKIGWVKSVNEAIFTFLAGPILVIGLVAAVPLVLGSWLRRIAGQAADFYDRVAEAQFLALTETLKEDEREHQLGYLLTRVMLPESRLCRRGLPDDESRQLVDAVICMDANMGRRSGLEDQEVLSKDEWAKCQFMLLFYRDFVDGAYFHRNDTKIANMLLGNLTLENVRVRRLKFGKKEGKRLDRLDVGRGKGGVSGPYVWFNFITHSVSQKVARLILEYNHHCIPKEELDAADQTDLDNFNGWMERRRELSRIRSQGLIVKSSEIEDEVDAEGGTLVYRTTEFNALHFLSDDVGRDQSIRERYGHTIADMLVEDRENLVREIFGTFPMHDLPRDKRRFNPYEFYGRFMSRGKVFLLPIVGAWYGFKVLRILTRRMIAIIRDVIRPSERPLALDRGRAGFDVAQRKIHRMRRPVVMEALRLRAAFDIQYLGLA
ncbi:MAG: hypothetical protein KDB53_11265, partial [Planctomycetes bacterium]|nr:hypothetical protein [Planctomycetota bacterium]